jgi:hypothetical protein
MTEHVIKAHSFANGAPCPHAGLYLKSMDFDAHDGIGAAEFTPRIERAMKFESATAALEFWRTVSKVKPIREDGKPNRPLTALTAEILPV